MGVFVLKPFQGFLCLRLAGGGKGNFFSHEYEYTQGNAGGYQKMQRIKGLTASDTHMASQGRACVTWFDDELMAFGFAPDGLVDDVVQKIIPFAGP